MPEEWKIGLICSLHKKGDQMQCPNYSGITFLSKKFKTFSKVLYKLILPYAEEAVGNYQCSFRHRNSNINQVYTLRQILENMVECNIQTHHLFADFSTAYDRINRAQLLATMKECNFRDKLLRLVNVTMENSQCLVKQQFDLPET